MSPAPAAGQVPASVSLFDLSADAPVLQGLSLVSHPPGEALAQALPTSSPDPGEKASPERKPLQGPLDISEKLFCSTCDQTFQNHQEQREHYKLDWHRFNLKQRLRNKPLLSALDFEKQSCTGDLSSISGSEDSDSASEDLQILDEERAELEKPIRPRGFHPHRVLFQNAQGQFLYAYRCVLGPHQVPPKEPELLLQTLQSGGPRCCVVLMAAAGHFAGAIFQGREVVVHKTFHRYTVRAKQGTAQGLRDARGGASRSAGANLRRYNEVTLCKDVRDLLAGPSWAEALGEAGTILLHTPRSGQSLFFGGHGAPLQRGDPRLWDIPLATRRPTFRELQRVLHKLTTLHVHGEDPRKTVWLDSPQSHWKTMKERKKAIEEERQVSNDENETLGQTEDSRKQGSGSEEEDNFQVELELVELTVGTLDLCEFEALPKRRRRKRSKREKSQDLDTGAHMTLLQQPQEDETFSHSAQAHAAPLGPSLEEVNAPDPPELWDVLLAACRAGDVGMLKLQLAISPADPRVLSLLSAPLGSSGFTLLHAAAAAGRGLVVRLLLEAGADPTVQDSRTRPPYMVAADKSTRNEFRRFMEKNPDAYDYNKAQVPGPLTPEMEAQQATRKRERKVARRQREEQQRKQQEQGRREQEEQRQFAALSDREKRALAAERRLAAQLGAPTPQIPNSAIISARRCWSCGTSLQGLIPFHYLDFSFCSTRCLQDHRCQARKPSS